GAKIAVERLEVEAMTENKPRPTRAPQSGDLIEITGHRVGDQPRSGEILEILGDPGEPHFRVRWEDGHESIFYPGNDAVVRRPRTKAYPTFRSRSSSVTAPSEAVRSSLRPPLLSLPAAAGRTRARAPPPAQAAPPASRATARACSRSPGGDARDR